VVSALQNGLNKDGVLGKISQGCTQALQRRVETSIRFDVSVSGPESLELFFARHHFAGALQKNREQAKRQILQPDSGALAQQFPTRQIGFEQAKAIAAFQIDWCGHEGRPLADLSVGAKVVARNAVRKSSIFLIS